MTMQIITEAEAALRRAEALFTSIGHAGAAKVKTLIAELRGDAGTLEHEAEQDATQVVHDAEQAAQPVEAEAEKDASKLAAEATVDVENAVQPPATS